MLPKGRYLSRLVTRWGMWEDAQGHGTRGDGAVTEVKARSAQPISWREESESGLGVGETLRVKIHLSGAAAVPWRARLGGGEVRSYARARNDSSLSSDGVAREETSASNFQLA